MNFLFEMYKDKNIGNSEIFKKEIRSKYKLTDKEINELYVSIVNYQVKTYGATLYGNHIESVDKKREKIRHQKRQREMRKRRGII